MNRKIITAQEAVNLAQRLHAERKAIVLVGGCFDILHVGHITLLEQAKKEGDVLIVFLEHDKRIKKLKGEKRPINTQEDRATILAALKVVDYVLLLPSEPNYDDLVISIKPAIIATTQGDPNRHHKERQAKAVNGKVIDVMSPIHNQSTTRLITLLEEL